MRHLIPSRLDLWITISIQHYFSILSSSFTESSSSKGDVKVPLRELLITLKFHLKVPIDLISSEAKFWLSTISFYRLLKQLSPSYHLCLVLLDASKRSPTQEMLKKKEQEGEIECSSSKKRAGRIRGWNIISYVFLEQQELRRSNNNPF